MPSDPPIQLSREDAYDAIVAKLEAELLALRQAAAAAHDEATHEDAVPEGKYDTRSVEASYLAGAQARRTGELAQALNRFLSVPRSIAHRPTRITGPGLVHVEVDGEDRWYFLSPAAGGVRVKVRGTIVQVLTPNTPMGRALIGAELDDEVEVALSGGTIEVAIVDLG